MSTESKRAALIEKFKAIAADRLEVLNRSWLQYESAPQDGAVAEEAMREIHTLKGEARFMGLADINLVAHKTEELMLRARSHGVTPELSNLILSGFDLIGALLNKQIGSGLATADLTGFVANVERMLGSGEASASAPMQTAAGGDEARVHLRRPVESSIRIDLKRLDELTERVVDLQLGHSRTEHLLQAVVRLAESFERGIERLSSRVPALLSAAQNEPDSELVRENSRKAVEELSAQAALCTSLNDALTQLRERLFETGLQCDELEDRIRETRLSPLSSLFNYYHRAICDLGQEQVKKINVQIAGENIAMDRFVLDKISEPLLHLIRNAIDHGIETPADRVASGKPETATLELLARLRGTFVDIVVRDDGRGIDVAAVKAAAARRGVIDATRAEHLTPAEALDLLFLPGFSTREQATDISGRGVGLDVVKQNVEAAGGAVSLQTELGKGTTVRLTVPVSFALKRIMVVEVAGSYYGLPADVVSTVAEVSPDQLTPAGTGRAFTINGQMVPVLELAAFVAPSAQTNTAERVRLVVIEQQDARLALVVEDLVGIRHLIQRPLGPFVAAAKLISGSAILADGKIILLLNASELFHASRDEQRRTPSVARQSSALPTILVADDSEVVRDFVVSTLARAGYRVIEAVNGRDALERARAERPALILTDLEMPLLDGFGLLREVRASNDLQETPVIVFSTRGADEDIRTAAELGANAYMVKSQFDESGLLRTVRRFLSEARE